MDALPFIPIIVEATKFIFNEASKWLDDVRKKAGQISTPVTSVSPEPDTKPKLGAEEFAALDLAPKSISKVIDLAKAETVAYEVQTLVEIIQIHRRNLLDHEKTESLYAELTPTYVRRAIEREANAILEKQARLTFLLEQVYGKQIDWH